MARTLLLVSLFVGSGSLFLGCTQDFNVFKPGQGGSSSQSSTATTTVTVVSSSSSSTGTGGAPECTPTDLSKCDDTNPCTTDSCDASGKCAHANIPDGQPPGYIDDHTDCVQELCTAGVLMPNAPENGDMPTDMNTCTKDSCSAGQKVFDPDPTQDGMSCGQGDLKCQAGVCVGCSVTSPCPQTPTFCQDVACTNMQCIVTAKNQGMALPSNQQTANDCKTATCDNNGNIVNTTADPNDHPTSTQCITYSCSGTTLTTVNASNTTDCNNGPSCPTPTSQKLQDKCNGNGACIAGATSNCMNHLKCEANACVPNCMANTDCSGAFVCDLNTGSPKINSCVQCESQPDCAALTATPVCDLGTVPALLDTCVECTASTTCANKRAPSAITCTAAAFPDKCACTTDADCFNGTAGNCNVATGACSCKTDPDCAPGTCNTAVTPHVCM